MMGLHDVSDALVHPGCALCRLKTESTDRFLNSLLARYERSDGLCLPHFRLCLSLTRDKDTFKALASAQQVIWQRLIGDLGEFIRKSDHRFRDETWGEEADAWPRALAALVGAHPSGTSAS